MLKHIIRRPTLSATRAKTILVLVALVAAIPVAAWNVAARRSSAAVAAPSSADAPHVAENPVEARRRADFAAMQAFRPGYAFWQHVFTIPDGSIAFGSETDGRLLATFPAKGLWTRPRTLGDPAIASIFDGQQFARKLSERRQQVALLLEDASGPVVHNSTRGDALLMNGPEVRPISRGVGHHLRAVRRAGRNWPGASHLRVRPESNAALRSQRRGLLPVAPEELEATEQLFADAYRGTKPNDAGSVLRRLPLRDSPPSTDRSSPRSQSTTQAARMSGGRSSTASTLVPRMSGPDIFWARGWPATCGRCRARNTLRSTRAMGRARISTRRWYSATRSTSET